MAVNGPVVVPGRNCWQIGRAERATVIVDAASYYHAVRQAMQEACNRILIIGWDFDTRILLEPDAGGKSGGGKSGGRKSGDRKPETLGAFFLRLAREKPDREIDVLKWSFGAKKQLLHPGAAWMLWRWARTKAITLKFDARHPPGCSHHQKVVVIDDRLAVCGGIDMSAGRWDTSQHRDDDPDRKLPDGSISMPWHDITMMMGPVARALGELGRDRWLAATMEGMPEAPPCDEDIWPADLAVEFEDVDIAISRTRAAYEDLSEIRENEALFLDIIAAARDFIYFENQYFTSAKIAGAIAKRLAEENPPEFIMVMPRTADGWLEQKAMDAARIKLVREIAGHDPKNRFRVYVPVTEKGEDIYVHAKLTIMDDRLLRVGSSNLNNRSMGLDSEADVTIDAALEANRHTPPLIRRIRHRLIAEHLGIEPESYAACEEGHGSMADAIRALAGKGRSLDLLDLVQPGPLDSFIAENELLDPERPEAFLEPIGRRGLRRSWFKGLRRISRG